MMLKKKKRNVLSILLAMGGITMFSNLHAAECSQATAGTGCYFVNVQDFSGHSFEHISFEPLDERDETSITAKYSNLLSYDMYGGYGTLPNIRENTVIYENPDEVGGNGGGPVSGSFFVNFGYYTPGSVVELVFVDPVDAVGAFFGGNSGPATIQVIYDDGNTYTESITSTGNAGVYNNYNLCQAINGFVGIDSNSGSKIKTVRFSASSDISSLDSIFFGDAIGGLNGQSFGPFPTSEYSSQCGGLGYLTTPELPDGSGTVNYFPIIGRILRS